MAKVICRTIDSNGNIIVTFYGNLALNSLVHDVEFTDGAVKHYTENVIAEKVLSQVDSSGLQTQALNKIAPDRKLCNNVSMKDEYVTTKRGVLKLRHTTIGWELHSEFRRSEF